MRTILLLLVAVVLYAPNISAQSGGFTVVLTVDGEPCGDAGLYKAYSRYEVPMATLKIADLIADEEYPTGKFIDAAGPGLYALTYCGRTVNPLVYAEPGDKIEITVGMNEQTLPVAIFKGDHAKENNFMAEYQAEIRRRGIAETRAPSPKRFSEFEAENIKRHWEWVKFFDTYFEGVKVPELFRHAVCTDIKCRRTKETIDYLMENYYLPVNMGNISQIARDEGFMNFEKDIPKADSLTVQYRCYRDMLQRYAMLLGYKMRADRLRNGEREVAGAARCTWDALCRLTDPLMRDAAMYSTILFNAQLPVEQFQESARKMLKEFRMEAKDYHYYVSAKEKVEGE